MTSLDEIKKGQRAVIKAFKNDLLSARLIEMGCLPGEVITLSKKAPLGCPYAIQVAGYELSLRKDEASAILVELVA
jgi:ferrous iron transport protein A